MKRAAGGALPCALLASAALVSGWVFPELFGVRLLLAGDRGVVVWTMAAQVVAAVWLVLFSAAGVWGCRGNSRGAARGAAAQAIGPLTLLPLSFLPFFFGGFIPQPVAASLLFYLPLGALAVSLSRWITGREHRDSESSIVGRGALGIGIVFWILYALVGWYFTQAVGQHAGDEGHYIVQAESLYHDHDLDLRNNLGPAKNPRSLHISASSRDGRWYSWHSFGLSLLLAPLVPGGILARHVLLGLLSGVSCAGMWTLCRLFSARRDWSLTALLLFALSTFWGVYSSRALPEVAGAAMATWAMVAILRQADRPWLSLCLCLACCAALPWLHTRFIPVSFAMAGVYGLIGLVRGGVNRRNLMRLSAFALGFFVIQAQFWLVQFQMFVHGLPVIAEGRLLSYPAGMWLAVASDRGLITSLPLFAAMAGAAVWVVLRDPANRSGVAAVLTVTGVVIVTSCAGRNYDGGATLPGRFLLVVTPLFVPCLARALGFLNPAARWWVVFLGLASCFRFALALLRLPEYYKFFASPRDAAGIVYDHLNGLVNIFSEHSSASSHTTGIVLIAGTGLLFFLKPGQRVVARLLPAVMVIVTALGGDYSYMPRIVAAAPRINAQRLARLGGSLERARVQVWGDLTPKDLFAVSDLFHGQKTDASHVELPVRAGDSGASGPLASWTSVTPPFPAGEGWRACRLRARLDAAGTAHWVIREGSRTLFEGPLTLGQQGEFEARAVLRTSGAGNLTVSVSADGAQAALKELALAWSPFSESLLEKAALRI